MKQLRVLVAEDNADMRITLVNQLWQDFQVLGAVHDGVQLVEAAVYLLPDVIVSDISMPRMSGLAARDELFRKQQATPFVFVSVIAKEVVHSVSSDHSVAFVHKGDLASHLNIAVVTVFGGRRYLSPLYE